MKAVVFKSVGDIRVEDVPEPTIQDATDAIIRITASSICGTDLHMVRGTMPGMKAGTILGHEAVGIVESVGVQVTNFSVGDRVVVCSTIACGACRFCQCGEFSSCDNANPNGPDAGTAFFGGPASTGPINGLQAERARIPFADTTLVRLSDSISDEDALLTSDIFPTGFMAAEFADINAGDSVAVFGCGPVGQMAIASAKLLGASEIFAVDCIPERLKLAQHQGAVSIDYASVDPVKTLKEYTNEVGPDACIDAVGVDAQSAPSGPAKADLQAKLLNTIDQRIVAPHAVPFGDQWRQGDAPTQVLRWCTEAVRKVGRISIVGVYPPQVQLYPIGGALEKSLTIRGANCSHRRYVERLLKLIEQGAFKPSQVLAQQKSLTAAVDCYKNFDHRQEGWFKVELLPGTEAAA